MNREKWKGLNQWAFWAALRLHMRALGCEEVCHLCEQMTVRLMTSDDG